MLNKSFKFTKDRILKIVPPKNKRDIYKDTKESGLILIVSYGGSKIFYLARRVKNKYRRIKIGRFPDLLISEARKKAIELKNLIVKEIDPTEKNNGLTNEITFTEILKKYINDYAKYNIKRWKYIENDLNKKAFCLINKKISDINKNDIQKIFDNLSEKSGKIAANRFIERMKSIFNKSIEWEFQKNNPAINIKKHPEKSRERFLQKEEITIFFKALEEETNKTIKDFVYISLYTGARKNNVLSMSWENINFAQSTWYIPETKNGNSQLIHLVPQAIEILKTRKILKESSWVFPSKKSASGHLQEPKKGWDRILKRAKMSLRQKTYKSYRIRKFGDKVVASSIRKSYK